MKKLYFISSFLFLSIALSEGMVAQEKGERVNVKEVPRVVCYTRTEIPPKLGNALHLGYSEDGADYGTNHKLTAARDVADPWYTGDFDATFDDVISGCRGLLEYIKEVYNL